VGRDGSHHSPRRHPVPYPSCACHDNGHALSITAMIMMMMTSLNDNIDNDITAEVTVMH